MQFESYPRSLIFLFLLSRRPNFTTLSLSLSNSKRLSPTPSEGTTQGEDERGRSEPAAADAAAAAAAAVGGDAAVPAVVDGGAVSGYGDAAADDVWTTLLALPPPPAAEAPPSEAPQSDSGFRRG